MSLRNWTPCDEPDLEGRHHCPYADDCDYVDCEYWCGTVEPQDDPEIWEEDEDEDEEDFDWDEDIEDTATPQTEMDAAIFLILMRDE